MGCSNLTNNGTELGSSGEIESSGRGVFEGFGLSGVARLLIWT
jgi:hypothetical protein